MYLRRCYRRKDGKRHAYWALVESYRTNRGPRQRVVAWLGVMDERGRLGVKRCAEKNAAYQTGLFTRTEPEWVEVDVKRVRVERSRKFGGPWLGRELLRRLELERFLEETLPNGFSNASSNCGMIEESPNGLGKRGQMRTRLFSFGRRVEWAEGGA
jgi:hypothetical protein